MHHCQRMVEHLMSIGIKLVLVKGVYLPYPEVAHNPPLHIIDDAIGYIVMWPWNQSSAYM
jgi:hypothetical protein